jgi:aminoglycoside/choline kinase family phosphotransferase
LKNTENLAQLYKTWSGQEPQTITPLPLSGSDRRYFRIYSKTKHAIGVYNPDKKENNAFITFTSHFKEKGLKVPEILAFDLDNHIYLLKDLGNTTLFTFLTQEKRLSPFSEDLKEIYKKVIEALPKFQIEAGKDLDFSVCYPRASFDKQSMSWDLNYFKYYFLKLAQVSFDEQELENDYQTLMEFLLKAPHDYFLYRDFQSRNIMIYEDDVYFIDYQGGRKGALQYDLASLLYDAKADIPQENRNELLDYYLQVLKQFIDIDEKQFRDYYYGYVLIRIMQAMGAYGFRGFYEKKEHFLKSIPFALDNLDWILQNIQLPVEIPTLWNVLGKLRQSERIQKVINERTRLKVVVNSFSFKRGIPIDESGNGGGHVFDCRALPNPGRYDEYKELTGKDESVINYLNEKPEPEIFFNNIKNIVDQSIENYLERGFSNLMISFGCTGGQHRSVFNAEKMTRYLNQTYDIDVILRHRELELK